MSRNKKVFATMMALAVLTSGYLWRRHSQSVRKTALHSQIAGLIPADVNGDGVIDLIKVFRIAKGYEDASYMEAIDIESSKSLWSATTVPMLAVHDLRNGQLSWKKASLDDSWGLFSRVQLRPDGLYVVTNGGVRKLEVATGKELWSAKANADRFDRWNSVELQFFGERILLTEMGQAVGVLNSADGTFSKATAYKSVVHGDAVLAPCNKTHCSSEGAEKEEMRRYICESTQPPSWCSPVADGFSSDISMFPGFWLSKFENIVGEMRPSIGPYLHWLERLKYGRPEHTLFYKEHLISIVHREDSTESYQAGKKYKIKTLVTISLDRDSTEAGDIIDWQLPQQDLGIAVYDPSYRTLGSQIPFRSVVGRYLPVELTGAEGHHLGLVDLDVGQVVWNSKPLHANRLLDDCRQK